MRPFQPTPKPPPTRALSRFAAFTVLATLGLIGLGGLVTSHGAGMAVPDWPTTYGYNMFLFPISQWVGGIFYEHTHRLYASGIGLLTVILAVWLHLAARRAGAGDSGQHLRRVARMGWLAAVLVVLQGILGGLRVSLMKDQIGIVHAALAQVFLVLLVWLALQTSAWWPRWQASAPAPSSRLAGLVGAATMLIFLQLLLGAAMRHQHAGLAIPDFPLAYGHLWPPTDEGSLARFNALRTDVRDFHAITPAHVYLHMSHRLLGVVVVILVTIAGRQWLRHFPAGTLASRLGWTWLLVIWSQVTLGAATVWSNKAADVATAHVVFGASALALGAVLSWMGRAARGTEPDAHTAPVGRSESAREIAAAPAGARSPM